MGALLRATTINFSEEFPYQKLMEKISEFLKCEMFIVDSKRKFLGFHYTKQSISDNTLKNFFNYQKISEHISTSVLNFYEIQENKAFEQSILASVKELKNDYSTSLVTVAPIYGNSLRIGTLFLLSDHSLEDEELALIEFVTSMIGLQLSYNLLEELESKQRDNTLATLIGSLSRSELESFKSIIEKIDL